MDLFDQALKSPRLRLTLSLSACVRVRVVSAIFFSRFRHFPFTCLLFFSFFFFCLSLGRARTEMEGELMAQQAALDTMVVKRIQEACAAEKAERAMDLASLLHLEKSYSIAIKASGLWRFYCCRFGSISCSSRALVVVFFRMFFSFLHACSGWGASSWKKAVFVVLEGPLGTRIVVLFLVVRPPERTEIFSIT